MKSLPDRIIQPRNQGLVSGNLIIISLEMDLSSLITPATIAFSMRKITSELKIFQKVAPDVFSFLAIHNEAE